jgi:hypothetical protein
MLAKNERATRFFQIARVIVNVHRGTPPGACSLLQGLV